MANVMQNRINAVLEVDQMQAIKDCINSLIELLPEAGNLTLTDDEKGQLASLDVDNKVFVEDVINECANNGAGIIPAVINPEFIKSDLRLFEQTDELHSMLTKALEVLENLRRIAASEAYGLSNVVYKIFAVAAASGIPNAQSSYEKLRARYKDNGSGGGATPQKAI
ncbi:hypothetical protein F0919_16575 [Taibaiella lutea]|uniref:Uncharacterized protein n=1 Tax=Taibaiella lutea TaxID=2608001 RepID=A0A5M6CG36_9BACT|nr:hypothetical protein [Taibaiella lutea]KAA5532405.1 hypothetical protein F0919_16575 [Taibaiella lutea]